jgi:hypothetical protein
MLFIFCVASFAAHALPLLRDMSIAPAEIDNGDGASCWLSLPKAWLLLN